MEGEKEERREGEDDDGLRKMLRDPRHWKRVHGGGARDKGSTRNRGVFVGEF